MNKPKFLFSLLITVVMMVMSPQRMWAEDFRLVNGDVTISSNATYDSFDIEGGALTIKNGVTVTVNGYCEINGGTVIIESGATLTVHDGHSNFVSVYGGILFNYGVIDADVDIEYNDEVGGVFSNLATVTGKVSNYNSSFYNYGVVYGSFDDDNNVIWTCPHGDESKMMIELTCTDDGYVKCNECGLISCQAPATGHTLTEHTAAAVTCTTDGYSSACWSCSECGEYFSDAEANTVIDASTVVIPATGHTFVNGACSSCGEAAPAYTLDKSKLNTALKAISGTYTLTFAYSAPAGATQGAALNSDNTIYLYSNGTDYTVAPTTSGAVIMAPADCSSMFAISSSNSYGYGYGYGNTTNSKNITSLNLTNFNTDNVTMMSSMFMGCSSLTSLDLSRFNTENVTNMPSMFQDCSSLTSLDLSSFNTSKVLVMSLMFNGCSQLQSLVIGNFDIENASSSFTPTLFTGCTNLNTLTLKALPYLADGTFNTQFTGTGKTVNYVLNDNSVVYTGTNYLPAATTAPTYTRSMTSQLETLVLPFAISVAGTEDYKVYAATAVGGTCTEAPLTGAIAAGTPVLVYLNDGVQLPYALTLTASSNAVSTTLNAEATAVSELNLTGSYAQTDLSSTAGYVLENGQFVKIANATNKAVSPFRAYVAGTGAKDIYKIGEHSLTAHDKVDPTCTTAGNTNYFSCSLCGKYFYDAKGTIEIAENSWVITALSHSFTNYTYNNDATCVNNGTLTATCDNGCGTTDTKDDAEHPATGHGFTNYTYNNDATCVNNGTMTATCDNGCELTDTKDDAEHPATGHSLTAHPAQEATYTQQGNDDYWTCSRCENLFGNAEGSIIVNEDDIIIPTIKRAFTFVEQDAMEIDYLGTAAFDIKEDMSITLTFDGDGNAVMIIGDNTVAKVNDDGALVVDFTTTLDEDELNKVSKEVGEGGYATLYSPFQLAVPAEGDVKVYAPTYDESEQALSLKNDNKVNGYIIPAGTGVLLKNEGTIDFTITTFAPTYTDMSALSGSVVEIDNPTEYDEVNGKTVYTLGYCNGKFGFYRYTGESLNPGLAYLYVNTLSPESTSLSVANLTTIIDGILKEQYSTSSDINNDGKLDLNDVNIMKCKILEIDYISDDKVILKVKLEETESEY